jgi:DNA-binding transcriptional LysR family regulator
MANEFRGPAGWSERIGRRITLRDLHILMAVVQAGSMARAAERMAVSQPVISKTISDLERLLGVRLLDRDRHGAEPTVYGAALLRHGVAAFDALRQGVQDIESLLDPDAGEVRIAASDPLTSGFIPAIIDRLSRAHPRIVFHISSGANLLGIERLRERKLDLIMGRLPRTRFDPDLDVEVLYDEPSLIAAGAGHPLVGRRRIKLAALMDEHWVLPDAESFVGTIVTELFRSNGLDLPRKKVFSTSIQLNNSLLATGRYLAFYPGSVIRLSAGRLGIKVLDLDLPLRSTPLGFITLKGRTLPTAARLFVEEARDVSRPWKESGRVGLKRRAAIHG